MRGRDLASMLATFAALLMPSASLPKYRPATKSPKSPETVAFLKRRAADKRARRADLAVAAALSEREGGCVMAEGSWEYLRDDLRQRLGWKEGQDPAPFDARIDAATPLRRAQWFASWRLGDADWAVYFADLLGVPYGDR